MIRASPGKEKDKQSGAETSPQVMAFSSIPTGEHRGGETPDNKKETAPNIKEMLEHQSKNLAQSLSQRDQQLMNNMKNEFQNILEKAQTMKALTNTDSSFPKGAQEPAKGKPKGKGANKKKHPDVTYPASIICPHVEALETCVLHATGGCPFMHPEDGVEHQLEKKKTY